MRALQYIIALLSLVSCARRAPLATTNVEQRKQIEFAPPITLGQERIIIEQEGRMWHLKASAAERGRTIEVPCSFLSCGTIYEAQLRTRHINDTDQKLSAEETIYLTQADTLRRHIASNTLITINITPKRCANGITVKIATPTLPKGVKVTHTDGSNPLRDALQPIPQSAIFAMEGYGLWDPSIVKANGRYHLFCSRWANDKQWQDSEVIRASSASLFGPYTFEEVILTADSLPWADRGVHNPKVIPIGGRYLLYYIGISNNRKGSTTPNKQTGFAFADNIEGKWQIIDHPTLPANNPAIVLHEDGSAYAVGKFHRHGNECLDGFNDVAMRAYTADSLMGKYSTLGDDGNRLPGELELEDPALRYINGRYHLLCTDWQGEATGVQKALVYYTSRDGVNYELYSQRSVWDQCDTVDMVGGGTLLCSQIERPELYINEDGKLRAILTGLISRPDDKGGYTNNFIAIRPVEGFDLK